MERLKVLIFGLLITFVLSSCSSIYWASVKNSTAEELMVKVVFKTEYGTQVMDMPLKAGEVNVWQYEQSSSESKIMDKYLSSIEISDGSGCYLVFNKEEIKKKVKNTTRQIVISPDDFQKACESKVNLNIL